VLNVEGDKNCAGNSYFSGSASVVRLLVDRCFERVNAMKRLQRLTSKNRRAGKPRSPGGTQNWDQPIGDLEFGPRRCRTRRPVEASETLVRLYPWRGEIALRTMAPATPSTGTAFDPFDLNSTTNQTPRNLLSGEKNRLLKRAKAGASLDG